MSAFACRKTIIKRLADNWTATGIAHDNENYAQTPGTPFVYCSVSVVDSSQKSLAGNPLVRSIGAITLNVFTPFGEGIGQGLQYADQLAAIFRLKTFAATETNGSPAGTIVCHVPRIDEGQQHPLDGGEWWRTSLYCGFYYDEHP